MIVFTNWMCLTIESPISKVVGGGIGVDEGDSDFGGSEELVDAAGGAASTSCSPGGADVCGAGEVAFLPGHFQVLNSVAGEGGEDCNIG